MRHAVRPTMPGSGELTDVGVRVVTDDLSVAVDESAQMPAIVHVYGVDGTTVVAEATSLMLRLASAHWRSLLVVPSSPAWDDAETRMASPQCRVIRAPTPARSGRVSTFGALRGVAGRARWLAAQDAVAVHAHDDIAALSWSPAVCRVDLPMVWDVDLAVAPDVADVVRLAGASYLLTTGVGGRMRNRRQPPSRPLRGAMDDLARSVDPLDVATVCDEVYRCLTGIRPASTPTATHDPGAIVRSP